MTTYIYDRDLEHSETSSMMTSSIHKTSELTLASLNTHIVAKVKLKINNDGLRWGDQRSCLHVYLENKLKSDNKLDVNKMT